MLLTGITLLDAIREHALRLLGHRGYSRGELAQRLESKGYDSAPIDVVVERLVACGLLDDEAYARKVAQTIVQRKPASAQLIEEKLIARRIPVELARQIAAETVADVDPVEAATRLAMCYSPVASPEAARRRIGSALARRGFDADIISAALEQAGLRPPEESFDQEHGT